MLGLAAAVAELVGGRTTSTKTLVPLRAPVRVNKRLPIRLLGHEHLIDVLVSHLRGFRIQPFDPPRCLSDRRRGHLCPLSLWTLILSGSLKSPDNFSHMVQTGVFSLHLHLQALLPLLSQQKLRFELGYLLLQVDHFLREVAALRALRL